MTRAGMTVGVDAVGNIRGVYPGAGPGERRLFIGSHLDTVPRAGAFDGVLGVVAGVALVETLAPRRLPFAIEIIGFSEEEGVRFGVPFIGSRALAGTLDDDLLGHTGRTRRHGAATPSPTSGSTPAVSARREPSTPPSGISRSTSSRGRCSTGGRCRSASWTASSASREPL